MKASLKVRTNLTIEIEAGDQKALFRLLASAKRFLASGPAASASRPTSSSARGR